MTHYAKIESGVVVHVLRVPPQTIMTASSAEAYIAAPDDVQEGWLFDGQTFTAPQGPQITADQLRATLTVEYERRMQVIAAGYPPSEVKTWPVQTQEARALLADPEAETAWIDAAALTRGIDRLELARRIVDKDVTYRVISGTLSGVRQRIEDQIDAASEDLQALQTIDVTIGWPENPT